MSAREFTDSPSAQDPESYEQLLQAVRDYEWLERCTLPTMDSDDVFSVMNTICSLFEERFLFDRFGILVGTVNERYCVIHEIVTRSDMEACPPGSLMIVKGTGLEHIYRTQQSHYNSNLALQPEFSEDDYLASIGLRSMVRLPLISRGQVFGVMTVKTVEPNAYSQSDIRLMEKVARRLSTSIYSLKLIYALRERSYRDSLTGLFNRRFLSDIADGQLDTVEEIGGLELPEHDRIAALFFDVDHFKDYNDQFGHATGDLRLVDVAGILKQQLQDVGLVIRYGGDEFVAVIPTDSEEEPVEWMQKIQQRIWSYNHQLKYPEADLPLRVSMGVAYGTWLELDKVLKTADMRMYSEKERHLAGFMNEK